MLQTFNVGVVCGCALVSSKALYLILVVLMVANTIFTEKELMVNIVEIVLNMK